MTTIQILILILQVVNLVFAGLTLRKTTEVQKAIKGLKEPDPFQAQAMRGAPVDQNWNRPVDHRRNPLR